MQTIPEGFTVVTSNQKVSFTIRISVKYLLLSASVLTAMGDPTHVMLATNDAGVVALIPTGPSDASLRVALNRVVSFGAKRRKVLGLDTGVYAVRVTDGIAYISADSRVS